MLVAPDWKQRHAAVMAISVTGEGCAAFLAPHLSRLVEMVLPRLSDESPRVRWAACNAIGQMASDFGVRVLVSLGARLTRWAVSNMNMVVCLSSPYCVVQEVSRQVPCRGVACAHSSNG